MGSVLCLRRAHDADGRQRHYLSSPYLRHLHADRLVEPDADVLTSDTVDLDPPLAPLDEIRWHDLQCGRALPTVNEHHIADFRPDACHIGGVQARHAAASVLRNRLRDSQGQAAHLVVY